MSDDFRADIGTDGIGTVGGTAEDLGEIAGIEGPRFPRHTLDDGADGEARFRFTLSEAKQVSLGLRQLDRDASLAIEDENGAELYRSAAAGTANEWISATLLAGTYYIRVQAEEAGRNDFVLRYGVTEADADEVARLEALRNPVTEPGDPVPALQVEDAQVTEGQSATMRFRVTLDEASSEEVTVRYETVEGTALEGRDYEAVSGTLVFAAGETEKWVEVSIDDDRAEERDETFTLRLSDATGAEISDAEGIGTIFNDDMLFETVPERPGEDMPGDIGTDGVIVIGDSVTGAIQTPHDQDWYAVWLEPGKVYRIELESVFESDSPLRDGFIRGLYDVNGNFVAGTADDDGGSGRDSVLYFAPQWTGTFYIAAGAYLSDTGEYTLSVTEHETAETNDFPDGPHTLLGVGEDGTASGTIGFAGDKDWVAVTLEAGTNYRIDLKGMPTGDGTLGDPFLHGIYDSDGNRASAARNDDFSTTNSRVYFTPAETGTYFVEAGAYGAGTGTFTLSVEAAEELESDDFANHSGTTGTLGLDEASAGSFDFAGDTDWFGATLEAGKTYRVELRDAQDNGSSMPHLHVRGVYDSDGALAADLWGTREKYGNNVAFFTAEEAGTYFFEASGIGRSAGDYVVTLEEVADDYSADTETSGSVAVGGSVTGSIDMLDDRDWIEVTLEAGTAYRIGLTGSRDGDGTLLNPYLRGIHDSEGRMIAGTSDGFGQVHRRSEIAFTAEEDGSYYVAAGAYQDRTGSYTLSVEEASETI